MSRRTHFDASGAAALRTAVPVVVLSAALFSGAALLLPEPTAVWLFSEQGPLEIVAIWLWIALAGVLLAVMRPLTPAVVAGAYICLCCAAREADWHTRFTGYSVMKVHFYYLPDHPLAHRLIAGAVVVPLIVSLVVLGVALVRRALSENLRALPAWLVLVAVGGAIVVATKTLDRVPEMLEDAAQFKMSSRGALVFSAWEEGFETLMPILFGAASIALLRQERRKRGLAAEPSSTAPGL